MNSDILIDMNSDTKSRTMSNDNASSIVDAHSEVKCEIPISIVKSVLERMIQCGICHEYPMVPCVLFPKSGNGKPEKHIYCRKCIDSIPYANFTFPSPMTRTDIDPYHGVVDVYILRELLEEFCKIGVIPRDELMYEFTDISMIYEYLEKIPRLSNRIREIPKLSKIKPDVIRNACLIKHLINRNLITAFEEVAIIGQMYSSKYAVIVDTLLAAHELYGISELAEYMKNNQQTLYELFGSLKQSTNAKQILIEFTHLYPVHIDMLSSEFTTRTLAELSNEYPRIFISAISNINSCQRLHSYILSVLNLPCEALKETISQDIKTNKDWCVHLPMIVVFILCDIETWFVMDLVNQCGIFTVPFQKPY